MSVLASLRLELNLTCFVAVNFQPAVSLGFKSLPWTATALRPALLSTSVVLDGAVVLLLSSAPSSMSSMARAAKRLWVTAALSCDDAEAIFGVGEPSAAGAEGAGASGRPTQLCAAAVLELSLGEAN